MGKYDLDNNAYDSWLAKNGKEKELKARKADRKNANNGRIGWHFGLGDKPVRTKTVKEFNKALKDRGLMLKGDVRKELR